ncbi:dimethylargininase [Longispora albida]|uniref:dimethylargininase n=1 Tax=Longispora albida TaxID=203523 RepID=UPI000364EAC8|nr:dimethylargininase [Longispora albida]
MPSPSARRYLMCRPTHFDVVYSINPWMDPWADPDKPVDTALAVAQWEQLKETYLGLGHTVELVEPVEGLPDMVFAANGGTVIDGRAIVAKFRNTERTGEEPAYRAWLAGAGFEVRDAEYVNEGEGDYLLAGRWLLAGTGFRTDIRSHAETQEVFGRPVVSLTLVDPRWYHLDTALTVLDGETIAYYPAAFSAGSQAVLRRLFPDAIIATDHDAQVFGLNAASDGYNVILPEAATDFAAALRARGFNPIGLDLTELLKAGGSVKCCTLELRG